MKKKTFRELKIRAHSLNLHNLYKYLCRFDNLEECHKWIEDVFKNNTTPNKTSVPEADENSINDAEMEVLAGEADKTFNKPKKSSTKDKDMEEILERDLGWENESSAVQLELMAEEELLYDHKFFKRMMQNERPERHGEKSSIKDFWEKNKKDYLTSEYKFDSSGDFNCSAIARKLKEDGKFSSDVSTIIDHADLRNLNLKSTNRGNFNSKFSPNN